MPFQAECMLISGIAFDQGRGCVPIAVVQDPVILVRENNQSTWDSASGKKRYRENVSVDIRFRWEKKTLAFHVLL